MSILTRTLTALLAATTIVGSIAPRVEASARNGSHDSHRVLWQTVGNLGVRTYINPKQCFEEENKNLSGFYISNGPGFLVVCQDNRKEVGVEVEWTENDYDTIRHEVIHLIQDCKDGRGDGSLVPIMSRDKRVEFVQSVLSNDMIRRIIRSYRKRGADDATIHLEMEAFSGAAALTADDITVGVKQYCF